MLAAQNPRIEARYALDLYFKERGAYTTIPAPLVYPSRVAAVYGPRVEP
jgi:hypothetical protein